MGRPTNSLVGQRFGSLTVIERAENTNDRQTKWLCRCDCGETYVAYGLNLKAGRTTSCGCKRAEMDKEQMRQTSVSLDRLRKDASDPYQNLANAIVAVAADDYRDALKDGNKKTSDISGEVLPFIMVQNTDQCRFRRLAWYAAP